MSAEDAQRERSSVRPMRGLLLIIVIAVAITMLYKWSARRDQISWEHDAPAALQKSRADGKPVLLYFTASWCGPCQQMASDTWVQPEVETALRSYYAVKIDVDKDRASAEKYQINAVPTFILLDKSENPTKRASGFMSAEEFLAWIGG
jgi:thiol:disulfide interchange protein